MIIQKIYLFFLESILKSLGIEKSSVFIVPGNHDVKRDEIAELIIDSIINNENARKKKLMN
ncbi:hypothetical protein CMV37_23125 [Bacillus cereus]|nr:hypothetical protein CMV37_23125 [Bacillus cereus]